MNTDEVMLEAFDDSSWSEIFFLFGRFSVAGKVSVWPSPVTVAF
jgi:hypothetical protein